MCVCAFTCRRIYECVKGRGQGRGHLSPVLLSLGPAGTSHLAQKGEGRTFVHGLSLETQHHRCFLTTWFTPQNTHYIATRTPRALQLHTHSDTLGHNHRQTPSVTLSTNVLKTHTQAEQSQGEMILLILLMVLLPQTSMTLHAASLVAFKSHAHCKCTKCHGWAACALL